MITRIVKMQFKDEKVESFLLYFEEIRLSIEQMPGLIHLKLYRDIQDENIIFTISTWLEEKHLEAYRTSDLFDIVWTKTKALFGGKPEAWSLKLK